MLCVLRVVLATLTLREDIPMLCVQAERLAIKIFSKGPLAAFMRLRALSSPAGDNLMILALLMRFLTESSGSQAPRSSFYTFNLITAQYCLHAAGPRRLETRSWSESLMRALKAAPGSPCLDCIQFLLAALQRPGACMSDPAVWLFGGLCTRCFPSRHIPSWLNCRISTAASSSPDSIDFCFSTA